MIKQIKIILLALILCAGMIDVKAQDNLQGVNVIYVDVSAASGGDGNSWGTAFQHLNDALAVAISSDQIWVAAGKYYPDTGASSIDNDVNATFYTNQNIAIYGGFEGTELSLGERDFLEHLTILSGDIGEDDNLTSEGLVSSFDDINGNNSIHILTLENTNSAMVIDGVIINAGRALGSGVDRRGAGIICTNASLTIRNAVFRANFMQSRSVIGSCGGMTVSNSEFVNNRSSDVGAITTSTSTFNLVKFINNESGIQAALFYAGGASISVTNSQVYNNNSSNGAGTFRVQNGSLYLENVIISGNSAGRGAAIEFTGSADADLINVTIVGNEANNSGGAVLFNSTGTLNVTNSIIWNNQDSSGVNTLSSAINTNDSGTININNSDVSGSGGSNNWIPLNMNDGGSNFDEDPGLLNSSPPPVSTTSIDDFKLTSVSSLIDQGNNMAVLSVLDALNQDRVINGTVDLGAIESQFQADVATSMTSNEQIIDSGDPLLYSLEVDISGPDGIDFPVLLNTELPSSVSCSWSVAYSGNANGAINGAGNISEVLSMTNGSSATVSFICDSTLAFGDVIHNANTSLINGDDLNEINNTSQVIVTINSIPTDLTVYHTEIPSQALVGNNISYQFSVENLTANPASNVELLYQFDDFLYCDWNIAYFNGANGPNSGFNTLDELLSFPSNGRADVSMDCFVDNTLNGIIENTVDVTWNNGTDTDLSNNTETVSTDIVVVIDMIINFLDFTSSPYQIGDEVSYVFDVFNLSDYDTDQVTVTSSAPDTLTNCSWQCIDFDNATCNEVNTPGFVNDTVTIDADGGVLYLMQCEVAGEDQNGLVDLDIFTSGEPGTIDPNLVNNQSNSSIEVIIFKSGFE